MVNPDFNVLKDWMFGKLNSLLKDLEPNPEYPTLRMSLGEPSLQAPSFVNKELEKNSENYCAYFGSCHFSVLYNFATGSLHSKCRSRG